MFCCLWDCTRRFLVPALDKELGPKHQLIFLSCFKLIFFSCKCSRKTGRVKKTLTIVLILEGTVSGSFKTTGTAQCLAQWHVGSTHLSAFLEQKREEIPWCKSNRSSKMERPNVYIRATLPACFTSPLKTWSIRIAAVHTAPDVGPLTKTPQPHWKILSDIVNVCSLVLAF